MLTDFTRVHRKLQDGMDIEWPFEIIAKIVKEYLEKYQDIGGIVTFDEYGVSGHVNHRALFGALKSTGKKLGVPLYKLKSISVVTKFTFFFGAFIRYLVASLGMTSNSHFFASLDHYFKGRAAMFQHKSQLVWFRYLYLISSQYMIYNELERFD